SLPLSASRAIRERLTEVMYIVFPMIMGLHSMVVLSPASPVLKTQAGSNKCTFSVLIWSRSENCAASGPARYTDQSRYFFPSSCEQATNPENIAVNRKKQFKPFFSILIVKRLLKLYQHEKSAMATGMTSRMKLINICGFFFIPTRDSASAPGLTPAAPAGLDPGNPCP